MANKRKAVDGARAREASNPARSDAGAQDSPPRAREASNPSRADAGALDGTHVPDDWRHRTHRHDDDGQRAESPAAVAENPPHRIHPHDDEDVSQASHTGDSEWQLAAGDGADRDPAEGPVVDYERDWAPSADSRP